MRSINALIWRNLTAHALRSILTALAITLGVAMVLAASIVGQAAGQSASALAEEGPQIDLEVFSRDGAPFDDSVLDTLRVSPDVERVSPSLRVEAKGVDPQIGELTLLGVDPESYAAIHAPELVGGTFLDEPDAIVLPMAVAIDNGLNVGDTIALQSDGRRETLTVSGRLRLEQDVTALGDADTAYVPLQAAQKLSGAPEQIDRVEVALRPGVDAKQAQTDLAQLLGTDLAVVRSELGGGIAFNVVLVQGGLAMVGIIILFAAGFVILNAFTMSIAGRTREIGALRSLGMTRRQIIRIVLAEAGLLGLVGAALGLLVGVGLAWGVMRAMGTLDDAPFAVPWWGLTASPLVGLAVTVAGALAPARQASRVSPLAALRPQKTVASGWYVRHGGHVGAVLLALLLPSLAAYGLIARPSLWIAVAVVGVGIVLLLGAMVLLLPALVAPLAALIRPALVRWLGAIGRLAADSLTRNKLRSALTAGALIAALTTIMGGSGLMTMFYEGSIGTIAAASNEDMTIMNDLVGMMASGELSIDNVYQVMSALPPLDPKLVDAISSLAETGVIGVGRTGIASVSSELVTVPSGNLSTGIFVDPDFYLGIGNFEFFEGDSATALAWMERGRAVLLQPLAAERLGVGVGDTIPLETSRGEVDFTVAGIGGSALFSPIFPYADGETYFDLDGAFSLLIKIPDGQDSEAVRLQVKDAAAPFPNVTVVMDMESTVDQISKMMEQFQVLLNALLLVAVIVAGFGVVNTMVINVTERGHEIGLLRAVGATQRQVRQSIVVEAATLGLVAVVVAVALSLLMLLVYTVVVAPNGWGALGVPSDWAATWGLFLSALGDVGVLAVASLIFAPLVTALAAYYPARQAAAMDVVEATRSERVALKPAGAKRPEGRRRRRVAHSLAWTLAWRNLSQHRLRTALSALAVALGVAMTVAADVASDGVRAGVRAAEATKDATAWMTDLFEASLDAVGLVILLVAGFVILNGFAMSVTQRRRQIGGLRALGMTRGCKRSGVMRLLLVEALLTGGAGTLAGLLAGPLLGNGLLALTRSMGIETGRGSASPGSLALAVVMGVGITLLAVLAPARRATRISPLAALRAEETMSFGKNLVSTRTWLPGLLIVTGLALYLVVAPPGAWTLPPWDVVVPLALSILWLVGLLLILPALIGWMGQAARRLLARPAGAVGRLAADNLRRGRRRVTLTVLAFTVSLTMIVSMTGIVAFTFTVLFEYLTEGALAEQALIVVPFDLSSSDNLMREVSQFDLETLLLDQESLADFYALAEGRAEVGEGYAVIAPEIGALMPNYPSFIYDLDTLSRGRFYTFVEGDWSATRPVMEAGCGLLLHPGVAARNGVGIGDAITLQAVAHPIECTVAGIGAGGYHPASFISPAAKEAFDVTRPAALLFFPLPGTDRDRFEAELAALAEEHGVLMGESGDTRTAFSASGDLMVSLMSVLLMLAVLAAAMGVVNTTAMSVAERRRELGLLRAVGATRQQTTAVVIGEAALVGFIGGLLGLVAGGGVSLIYALATGGKSMGIADFPLWRAAWEATRPALLTGLVGLLAAPLVSAGAAWLPVRSILRGSAIETMEAERNQVFQKKPGFLRSLSFLALRNLAQHRLRTTLSALAVALGAATVVAADVISAALLNSLAGSGDAQKFMTGLLEQLGATLQMVGVGITLAAGFLIFNAFAMAVTQRRRQIGALRALGMTRRQVLRLVLVESLAVGGLGTLFGLVAGPLLGKGTIALMKVILGEGVFVFSTSNPSLSSLLLATVLGMGIALLSALVPAWQAARVSPLVALREESHVLEKPGFFRKTWFLGVLMVAVLSACLAVAPPGEWVEYPWDQTLTGAFVLIWLVGWGLIAPSLIGGLGRWTRGPLTRLWGATGRLMADNLRRGRGRVTLTIMTLVVGLTMIIGMTGFIHLAGDELLIPTLVSFERLRALIVSPFDVSKGMAAYADLEHIALPPELIAELPQAVGDRARVMDEWRFVIVPELSFFSSSYFSLVADPHDVQFSGDVFFDFIEGDWETAMPIMETGCGVLAPPMIASRNNVSVGETFEVTGKDGPIRCTLAGIGRTFVNSSIVSLAAKDVFSVTEPFLIHVVPQPGADRDQLRADLLDFLERYPGVYLIEPEAMYEAQVKVLEVMPDMLNALLLLAILAAALGVVNTTMMSVAERRRELGLLRAVGATRRQVMRVVTGEAALMGVIGGGLGLVVGVGVVVIIVVTYGGNSWGVPDLDLWGAAWRSVQPALVNGLVGLIAAPFISAGAAWLPARSILRGSAIETMEPARQETRVFGKNLISPAGLLSRGSIRTRFALGTATLMTLVLVGLIAVVTTHARTRIKEQMHDALRTMVTWNAGMIELGLPDDAETLDFDTLTTGQAFDFDADALLQFESLVDDMTANGLVDFVIADRDDVVIIGLDTREIGTLAPELRAHDEADVYSEREDGEWLMHASAPVRNDDGLLVGSVRLTVDTREMQDFLSRLRNKLGIVGVAILLFGVAVSWGLATPLARATWRLADRAARVAQGEYLPYSHASTFLSRFSLRNKLTAAMVLIIALMVGVLQVVAIPIERRHIEDTLKDGLVASAEWIGQAVSESFDLELPEDVSFERLSDFDALFDAAEGLDLARMQGLAEQAQTRDLAYSALVDNDGTVILSDQLGLIGEVVSAPSDTQIEEATWHEDDVWVVSTPLRKGQNGERLGALRMAVRRERVETFLDESRNLFRLTGLIAVLAGVLLAQAIGGAVTAPVRQLAADTRRVAEGDLTVQFRVDSKDELALLANAYNQMVVGLREREWLRDVFGRFVSREVAEAIRSGQVRLEGENRVVSVLFCDIRDFTARSERSTPEEVVALLNEYLPVVVEAAQSHAGTVNKFGGDSTLVIYGAPRQLQESAYQAVLTALEMRANLRALNARLAERGEAPIHIGVGINTGVALAGAVGTEERQEYTVIGDTVNLASRIEALNKVYSEHDILISGWTYEALGSRRGEFEFADLGEVQIRGKAEPVRVWAVTKRRKL